MDERKCLPERGTGVLERLMREMNARTDIGGSRWSTAGLRDLFTVQTARLLGHPSWHDLKRTTHRRNTITLQKLNASCRYRLIGERARRSAI